MKRFKSSKGFTLIEVLIALTIFAFFITAYVMSQGSNLADSLTMRQDLKLSDLCQQKINEIMASPPELNEALTLRKETKTFEDDEDYEYTISYKKFIVPDMTHFKNKDDEEENAEKARVEKIIAKNIKDAMEKMLWQLEVTVKNKNDGQIFTLTSWLYNDGAEFEISI